MKSFPRKRGRLALGIICGFTGLCTGSLLAPFEFKVGPFAKETGAEGFRCFSYSKGLRSCGLTFRGTPGELTPGRYGLMEWGQSSNYQAVTYRFIRVSSLNFYLYLPK